MVGIPKYDRVHIASEQNNLGESKDTIVFDDAIFKLTSIREYFFTQKEDRSLENIGIIVGSLVLCRKTKKIPNNSIGIFRTNDLAIMREIQYLNDDEAYLIPHSNDKEFSKIKIKLKDITIIAQVEKVILDFTQTLV